ncbi:MAG: hypothetical protein IVW53_15875 [Chloroflexi bacterium]|nr:hypothetical protein [Chloroflexota bacterium]
MNEGHFGTKKLTLHGVELWWICRKTNGRLVPYADILAPTGYGFKNRAKAERAAQGIEERLQQTAQKSEGSNA